TATQRRVIHRCCRALSLNRATREPGPPTEGATRGTIAGQRFGPVGGGGGSAGPRVGAVGGGGFIGVSPQGGLEIVSPNVETPRGASQRRRNRLRSSKTSSGRGLCNRFPPRRRPTGRLYIERATNRHS